jgi:tetratricopeptide (TPR) repeat protein
VPRFPALILNSVFIFGALCAQETPKKPAERKPPPAGQQEVPPEEDETVRDVNKTYPFNPLQAEKEVKIGNFYLHKGSYRAAEGRFREALKWNPGLVDAYLRLAEAEEKLNDTKAVREAYSKYLEMAPRGKQAESVRKKLAALPPEPAKEAASADPAKK